MGSFVGSIVVSSNFRQAADAGRSDERGNEREQTDNAEEDESDTKLHESHPL